MQEGDNINNISNEFIENIVKDICNIIEKKNLITEDTTEDITEDINKDFPLPIEETNLTDETNTKEETNPNNDITKCNNPSCRCNPCTCDPCKCHDLKSYTNLKSTINSNKLYKRNNNDIRCLVDSRFSNVIFYSMIIGFISVVPTMYYLFN